MNTLNLIVGDWSHDGHNMTQTCVIESNLDCIQLHKAYKKGSKIFGYDLVEKVCNEYQDGVVPKKIFDKFNKTEWAQTVDKDESGDACPTCEDWVDMYLFVVKLGNPDFQYKKIENNNVYIGGYGLFK